MSEAGGQAPARGTAVGVFADRIHAEQAVEDLTRAGFTAEQIGFVVPDLPKGIEMPDLPKGGKVGEGLGVGVVTGLALGGLVGVALSTILLPGVGTVLSGGLLAGALGSAVGATGGGIFGALVGMSIPEEEARHLEREFHSGRTLVTVRAGERYDEAVGILDRAAKAREHHAGHSRPHVIEEGDGGTVGNSVMPRP